MGITVGSQGADPVGSVHVPISDAEKRSLLEHADAVRTHAYAPYSGFSVGAAVLADGDIFVGANVENRAYGSTICAERSAIAAAVAAGRRHVTAIAIAAEASTVPPCGECLQVISEFAARDAELIFCFQGELVTRPLRELLPYTFPVTDGELGE